ncbi:MAG: hypothetical protein JNL70_05130 [Saprospiraceae bacterium]|nr:hypothetical protein [Saprospiraceae bacterium]
MKKQAILFCFLIIVLILNGCDLDDRSPTTTSNGIEKSSLEKKNSNEPQLPSATTSDIYTQAAIETCNCLQPLITKAQKLKDLEMNKQTSEIKKVAREMDALRPEIQKCSDEIKKKYPQIDGKESGKRILNACIKQCPNMVNLFGQNQHH